MDTNSTHGAHGAAPFRVRAERKAWKLRSFGDLRVTTLELAIGRQGRCLPVGAGDLR